MSQKISYNYALMKDGTVEFTEQKWPQISVHSLSDLPVVGDAVHFRYDDDGPRGTYKVVKRALMVGQSGNEYRIEATIFIERVR